MNTTKLRAILIVSSLWSLGSIAGMLSCEAPHPESSQRRKLEIRYEKGAASDVKISYPAAEDGELSYYDRTARSKMAKVLKMTDVQEVSFSYSNFDKDCRNRSPRDERVMHCRGSSTVKLSSQIGKEATVDLKEVLPNLIGRRDTAITAYTVSDLIRYELHLEYPIDEKNKEKGAHAFKLSLAFPEKDCKLQK